MQLMKLGFLGCLSVVGCAVGVGATGSSDNDPNGGQGDSGPLELPSTDGGLDVVGSNVDSSPTTADAGSSCAASTGVLVTYDFTGQPGNQTSTAATSTMAGATAGSAARSTSITAVAGAGSINASDWSTSSIDPTRYYTLTVTPSGSCALDITSVSIDTKASGTGPSTAAIATSDDNFVTMSSFTPGTVQVVSLSVTGATTAVEVRIYGYSASGTEGTLRIENTLTVSGALQ
jgi:hypothetical protein